jgi:DNA gyrase subunit A
MQNYLHGPDFPTGGVILGRKASLITYDRHWFGHDPQQIPHRRRRNGKARIIVTEIPYQVNKAAMIREYGPARP